MPTYIDKKQWHPQQWHLPDKSSLDRHGKRYDCRQAINMRFVHNIIPGKNLQSICYMQLPPSIPHSVTTIS